MKVGFNAFQYMTLDFLLELTYPNLKCNVDFWQLCLHILFDSVIYLKFKVKFRLILITTQLQVLTNPCDDKKRHICHHNYSSSSLQFPHKGILTKLKAPSAQVVGIKPALLPICL